MRAVIQRASRADVTINHGEKREIGEGLVVFLCVMKGDSEKQAEYMAEKISHLRIFSDEFDRMNLSLKDIGGEILLISNFTLSADCKKGRRPFFDESAPPDEAENLFIKTVSLMKTHVENVIMGEFGAHMDVNVLNNGPITILLDTEKTGH